MNNHYQIVFSPLAQQRLDEIAQYLFEATQSNEQVIRYLKRFEAFLDKVLLTFPESGTPMPQYGEDVRRIVYERYSFLYRIKGQHIEILTVYRENQPFN